MQTAAIDSAEFGLATAAAFSAAQGSAGRFSDWNAGSWAALLEYLRSIRVPLANPPAPVVTAADVLLTRYSEY
ncbi:hypothetical protein GCM10011609_84700 [Lentzea pudingi]|uniref:Uncharacterized protein n=2 Tax=Lentzea pudingi TaxID=1789439 RepID=A0ABQ2ISW8_9PSEU|nr:hypothetical protein GCM10011609_84700 [Lentzea pudingi]